MSSATLALGPASSPFVAVLGADIQEAAPAVRAHLSQTAGTRRYRGVLRRYWRHGGLPGRVVAAALGMGAWAGILARRDDAEPPFELECRVAQRPDGRDSLIWTRTFHFRRGTRRFAGTLSAAPERRAVVDTLGGWRVEVELVPRVAGDAVVLASGRQWLRLGAVRLGLPRRLFGWAVIQEWEERDGRIGLRLSVHHPLLGAYLGYEALLAPVAQPAGRAGGRWRA